MENKLTINSNFIQTESFTEFNSLCKLAKIEINYSKKCIVNVKPAYEIYAALI